jgi:hypothetical protein
MLYADTWKPLAPEGPFQTMALWQGTFVSEADDVESFFLEKLGARIRRVGCVNTSKGRVDFVFFVHSEDVAKFAVQRLKLGQDMPRWWEDIYFNNQQDQFPQSFLDFYPDPTKKM